VGVCSNRMQGVAAHVQQRCHLVKQVPDEARRSWPDGAGTNRLQRRRSGARQHINAAVETSPYQCAEPAARLRVCGRSSGAGWTPLRTLIDR